MEERLSSTDKKDVSLGEQGFDVAVGQVVNASGHKDQLKRQYGLVAICALALTVDNAWIALGGSVDISIGKQSQTNMFPERIH